MVYRSDDGSPTNRVHLDAYHAPAAADGTGQGNFTPAEQHGSLLTPGTGEGIKSGTHTYETVSLDDRSKENGNVQSKQ